MNALRSKSSGSPVLRWLSVAAAYALIVLAWQFAGPVFHVPTYVLPPPSDIIHRLAERQHLLLTSTITTLNEVVLGFLVGVVVSIPLALVIVSSRLAERFVYPLLIAFQAVPKVALAPILVVWFGFGMTSKVMLGFVTAMFPIVINTVIGLRQTSPEMIHLMRSLGATPMQTFFKIRIFAAAPFIFGGLKVGITLAVVGAVVGEFIASNSGLGNMLLTSSNAFDTPLLFGVVLMLSLVSVVLFYAVELIERLVLPKPLRTSGEGAQRGAGL